MSIKNPGKKNKSDEISTKEKIVICAVNLFAVKGFTETTIRELADEAGLKGGSIYNHFPSKNAILKYILDDYFTYTSGFFNKDVARTKLEKDSTIDGIMDCLKLTFPEGRTDYYLKVLCVLLQEQHRNKEIHDFVTNQIILWGENNITDVFEILKDLNVIRKNADIDPWVKVHSSLLYAFSSRMMLGIGDASHGYSGMGMTELVRYMIEMTLKMCAVENES